MKYLFYAIIVTVLLHHSTGKAITLDDRRQLNDILVYINDNVPENQGYLLENIKESFMHASQVLYKATNALTSESAGVMFGSVYIRVPRTWKVNGGALTWQNCVTSNIQIVADITGTKPLTKQLGKCGEPADHTKFPYSFFNQSKPKKSIGKEIVREFVRLRYGVFPEEPYQNQMVVFNGHNLVNGGCPVNIKLTLDNPMPVCSDINNICTYSIYPNQNHNYSLMFDTETDSTEYFCNNFTRKHNKFAHSLQNIKCRLDISSVILKHEDFVLKNPNKNYKKPSFHIVKGQSRRLVFVIDVSGSMYYGISKVKTILNRIINDTIENGAEIGIVTFNKYAKVISNLTEINPNSRKQILQNIAQIQAWGPTNIGDGLAIGVETLGGNIHNNDTVFGTIVLLSDGENNVDGKVNYSIAVNQIIIKQIVTYAISYGLIADSSLSNLTHKTKGMFFFVNNSDTETKLADKLTFRKPCDNSANVRRKTKDGIVELKFGDTIKNLTYIDKFMGENTEITIDYIPYFKNFLVTIIDPNGKEFNPHVNNNKTIIFIINGKAEPGQYQLKMIPKSFFFFRQKRSLELSNKTQFSISFKLESKNQNKYFINAVGELSNNLLGKSINKNSVRIIIDVRSNNLPSMNLLKSKLLVMFPNNKKMTFNLTDDGENDDSIANDLIYTKILTTDVLIQKGTYTFIGILTFSFEKSYIQQLVTYENLIVL